MVVAKRSEDPAPGSTGVARADRFIADKDLTHGNSSLDGLLASVTQRLNGRLGPNATLIVILTIGMVVVAALSIIVAQIYDAITDKNGVAGLDQPLLDLAIGLRSPAVDIVVTGYTDIAGPIVMPILAVLALLIFSTHRRSWMPTILILAGAGGSLLMTIAGKGLIHRVRPDLVYAVPPYEHSPSFPSGHTLNAVVIAGIVAYLLVLRRRSTPVRIVTISVAVLFAVTIGFSRVFLGHHWFTDVLAGWVLGALWLAIVITAHRLYVAVRKRCGGDTKAVLVSTS